MLKEKGILLRSLLHALSKDTIKLSEIKLIIRFYGLKINHLD